MAVVASFAVRFSCRSPFCGGYELTDATESLTLNDEDGDDEPGDGGAHPPVQVVLVEAVEDDEVGVGEEGQDLRNGLGRAFCTCQAEKRRTHLFAED